MRDKKIHVPLKMQEISLSFENTEIPIFENTGQKRNQSNVAIYARRIIKIFYPASVRFSEFHWPKDITWRQDKSRILPPRVRLRKKEDIAFYRTLLTSEKKQVLSVRGFWMCQQFRMSENL